jgi:tol-pal system protein YbgF
MTRIHFRAQRARTLPIAILVAVLAAVVTWPASGALAQNSGGFLDNLFNPNRQNAAPPEAQQPAAQQPAAQQAPPAQPQVAQTGSAGDENELGMRVGRIENALRQLTGTIEQLQHQNQMLQMQLKRMQDDTEFRFQQLGSRGGGVAPPAAAPPVTAPPGAAPARAAPGQRSDVFDPSRDPNAPGAPRTLGNASAPAQPPAAGQQIGAPGGREAGAPLDLSTLAGNPPAAQQPQEAPPMTAPPQNGQPVQPQASQPPPARNANVQLATLPPSASPKDEFQLAYGYVLHKDYALAEQAFRNFLSRYPGEANAADAHYWLGESLYQQQRYRDAAESFLAVSTKYAKSSKAPDSLLRLGESLAALNQREAACATFAEIKRKYPRASSAVKNGVAREQKRAHC